MIKLRSYRNIKFSTARISRLFKVYNINANCNKVVGKNVWYINNGNIYTRLEHLSNGKLEVRIISTNKLEYFDQSTPCIQYLLNLLADNI